MLAKIIPSYLYTGFADDADLQAFMVAFNQLAQEYVDWFNTINLPIYTGDQISGDLLDWVAAGLYGQMRPSLPAGSPHNIGMYNTAAFNTMAYNQFRILGPISYYVATDDIFKRVMTWNLYKGDGTTFNIRWLKRRIQRFLTGENGVDPGVSETYQISVTFGAHQQINISIITGGRTITGGALYNRFAYNKTAYNSITSVYSPLTPSPFAPIFKSAMEAGVLNVPFQYTFAVG